MNYKKLSLALTVLISLCFGSTSLANLTIASNGQSDYTIVIPSKPALSVKNAAKELHRDIKESTGAELDIVSDTSNKVSKPFISLGSTKQAKKIGLDIKNITPSGFKILTKNSNLYIRGLDTAAKVNLSRYKGNYGKMTPQPNIPGPQYTKNGGWSNGTANGVYTFLEKRLGVRWLMPGKLGHVVPKHDTFKIPEINRVQQPEFILRYLGGLEKYPQSIDSVHTWMNRQKLGFSFRLNGNHNLWKTVIGTSHVESKPKKLIELYKKHKDWFAMNAEGKRPMPTSHYDKLETTNQGLVKYFADQAVKALKTNPHMNTYSLSLADGHGYSQSPQSKALYDPPPPGSKDPSVTPMVLKWYHDVANAVAKQDPNALLAGFLYQQYIYPPKQGADKLLENFIPFIAPSFDYGYQLYRKDIRKKFDYIFSSWAKIAPSKWFYFDLPNTLFRWQNGTVTPPATDILNFIFPRLLKYHIKGAHFYGNISWSMAALTNYIDAKLLWNPKLDANTIKRDWLNHAYGKQAGTVMETFYIHLSNYFSNYWNKYHRARYYATEKLFEKLYGQHYAQLESIYLKALSKPMTASQKKRLELIGKNLSVLQWRLKNADNLSENYKSQLTLSNKKVAKLLFKKMDSGTNLFPILWYQRQPKRTRTTVKTSSPVNNNNKPPKNVKTPNSGYIMFYTTKDQEIIIHPVKVNPNSSFVGYRVYWPRGKRKWSYKQGLFYSKGTITINAKANTPYYLSTIAHGIVPVKRTQDNISYILNIPNAQLALASYKDKVITLHPIKDKNASLYVYSPENLHLSSKESAGNGVILGTQSQADSIRENFISKHKGTKVVKKLDEDWKFKTDSKDIGKKDGFSKTNFNDNDWKTVSAIDWWQNQGFPNYHGTAWYRRTFKAPKIKKNRKYYLFFGNIDGDAVIYINDNFAYRSKLGNDGHAWDEPLTVNITKLLNSGNNTIAIKVTKKSHAAGIYRGVAILTK